MRGPLARRPVNPRGVHALATAEVFSNVKNGRLLTGIGAPINKLFLIIYFSITIIDLLIPNPALRIVYVT
jgi:hypothetical protein